MNLKRRIAKMEDRFFKTNLVPKLDVELTEWFQSNSEYTLHDIPEHLCPTLRRRMDKMFIEKNLPLNYMSLLNLSDSDFRLVFS